MIFNLSNDNDIRKLIDFVLNVKDQSIEVKIHKNTRTNRQNRAIWLYCTLLSEALNDAGLYLPIDFLNSTYQISWTKTSTMELIWKPMQEGLFKISSTTKLKTNEVSQVYEEINRALSEEYGLSLPFPNFDYKDNK